MVNTAKNSITVNRTTSTEEQPEKVTSCARHGYKLANDGVLIGTFNRKCPTCKLVRKNAPKKVNLECAHHFVKISRHGRLIGTPGHTCKVCKAIMTIVRKREEAKMSRSVKQGHEIRRMSEHFRNAR